MKPTSDKTAIVIATFGTTSPLAVGTLLTIVHETKTTYPNNPVQLAFTSNIIRKKWHSRAADQLFRNKHPEVPDHFYGVNNLLGTLTELLDTGFKEIVVQPTLLTYGKEFLNAQASIEGLLSVDRVKERWQPPIKIALGRPLMGSGRNNQPNSNDLQQLAEAVAPDIALAQAANATLVYMGHGNKQLSNKIYTEFENMMNQRYPQSLVRVGLVEGHPDFSETLKKLQQDTNNNLLLKPLMIVAGDHASKDLIGTDCDSWKTQLEAEAFMVQPVMRGLGDNPAVRQQLTNLLFDAAMEAGIVLG